MIARLSPLRKVAVSLAAVVAGVAVVLGVSVPGSLGAYSAKITNSGASVSTATYLTCTAANKGYGSAIAWPLDDAGVVNIAGAARDVSGNNRAGLFTVGGVTYQRATTACPRDPNTATSTPYAVTLNGSSGYLGYGNSFPLTNTFTIGIWFNTQTTAGGRLIGFGNAATGASTQYDRQIWMTTGGQLYFGVYPTTVRTVNSTAAYNDGKWHQAVATLGTNGMVLYVDGVQVAQDTGTTTAQVYSTNAMYLRVGYDNLDFWPNNPTSYYFGGSVRFADFFTTTLTATQVAALYAAGTGS